MKSKLSHLACLIIILVLNACDSSNTSEQTDSVPDSMEFLKVAPEWSKNAVMYEVAVRQYTKEGTFSSFQEHLSRLEEMGVDILVFKPIHPIGEKNRKGSLGSQYSVRNYEGVNPEFGNMDDFKVLVDEAHARGMKVIIDWVANHTSWDNVWVEEGHLDWYTIDSIGGFESPAETDGRDVIELNFENDDMRARMISSMRFWLTEVGIDGFRCADALLVPGDFWNEVRIALDEVKPVFMLAEAEHVEHHETAFDMSYGWEYYSIVNELAQGTKDANHLAEYLKKERRFPSDAYRLLMTNDHDENTWEGTVEERLGAGVQAMAVMAATIQGMPLVSGGQEASLNQRLEVFEKDEISWNEIALQGFYTRLMQINHNNEALWNGVHGGETNIITTGDDKRVIAYHREKNGDSVLVILNMSSEERSVNLDGQGIAGFYEELFTGQEVEITINYSENLGPWNYRVYFIEN